MPLPGAQSEKIKVDPLVYRHWLFNTFLAPNQKWLNWILPTFDLIFSFFSLESGCASRAPLAAQASFAWNQFAFSSTSVNSHFRLVPGFVQVQVISLINMGWYYLICIHIRPLPKSSFHLSHPAVDAVLL